LLLIRLSRTGKRNNAAFRIVVAEHSAPIKGKFVEIVGHYIPTRTPKVFEYNLERINYWISVGAKPSDTVASLLKHNGVDGMEKYISRKDKKAKKKNEEEVVEEAPADNAEGGDAAPAEEPKAESSASSDPSENQEAKEEPKDESADSKPEEVKEEPAAEEKSEEKPDSQDKPENDSAEKKADVSDEAESSETKGEEPAEEAPKE